VKDGKKVMDIHVEIPPNPLCRNIHNIARKGDSNPDGGKYLHPSQRMTGIILETTYQKQEGLWDGSVDAVTKNQASFLKQNVYRGFGQLIIGSDPGCSLPLDFDPHLSRFHLTIFRDDPTGCFLIRPEGTIETNQYIHLLLGPSRFPFTLRTGDVFTVGLSEFKVVYQHRGTNDKQLFMHRNIHDMTSTDLVVKNKPGPPFSDLNELLSTAGSLMDQNGPFKYQRTR